MMSGMALLAISFNLFLIFYETPASPWFFVAIVLFVLAILSWFVAIDRAKSQDNKRERQMAILLEELKGFRKDFNKDDK